MKKSGNVLTFIFRNIINLIIIILSINLIVNQSSDGKILAPYILIASSILYSIDGVSLYKENQKLNAIISFLISLFAIIFSVYTIFN